MGRKKQLGPLSYEFAGFDSDGFQFFRIWRRDGMVADVEPEEYAILFCAAPDLLKVVQQIFNGIDTGMITIDTPADETLAKVLSRGRKALSKATGVI